MREQHLDLFAQSPRRSPLPRFCDLAGHVASALVDGHRHCRWLSARYNRPCRYARADKCDEFAPLHSITSSASNCIELGTFRLSAFAVLMLMTSSNLLIC